MEGTTLIRSLAEELRRERQERGWSQERMAREIGVTLGAFRNYEKGRSKPAWDEWASICATLGWPHLMLMDDQTSRVWLVAAFA